MVEAEPATRKADKEHCKPAAIATAPSQYVRTEIVDVAIAIGAVDTAQRIAVYTES